MQLKEYRQSLLNTIKEIYTVQMKKDFVKFLHENGIINNRKNRYSNKSSLVADVTEIEDLQRKLEYILLREDERIPENILKYLEMYEYLKPYKNFVVFKYDKDIRVKLQEMIQNKEFSAFDIKSDEAECGTNDLKLSKCDFQKNTNENIYLKYTQILKDVEGNLIKFVIIVIINESNKTLHICFDNILKKYHAHKKDFYLQAIIHIQKCIEDLFEIKVEIIEFRSIVDYIKNYKENEVDVHGELVMNNGRKAKLDSSKINGQYQKPLFIGDFKQFLKNPDNEALIDTCDATRELARRFQSLIEEIEDTSDYPQRKILFLKDDLDVKLVHDYKDSEITLFTFIGDLKFGKEWSIYVYEKFRIYFEEYNEYIQSDSFSD